MAESKKRAGDRAAACVPGDEREYRRYPPDPAPPYRERRSAAAARRSGRSASGAAAPRPGTRRWRPGVFRGPCLLLRAEGLHSCPQMAWSVYRRTVAEVVGPPPELVLLA
ncbi:hypothetical protein [Streptomyces sp. NPDC001056]